MVEKKFQVFVSSTYIDLIDERQEVMQALLELDCIPSGMELFPASDEEKWELIKKVIDDCDYYIVIVGGRYGSTEDDGISYTEKEYRYALDKGIPILAFLHEDPGEIIAKKTDQEDEKRKKLEEFRNELRKRICKHWKDASGLGSVVSRSLVKLIKRDPGIGWVRADNLPDEETSKLMLKLQRENEELKEEIENISTNPPEGSENLASGDEIVKISNIYHGYNSFSKPKRKTFQFYIEPTWDELYSVISPSLIGEMSDDDLKLLVSHYIDSRIRDKAIKDLDEKGWELVNGYSIEQVSYDTMKVQFIALGLITKSEKKRGIKDTATYWTLTPYGHMLMTQLRARKKGSK